MKLLAFDTSTDACTVGVQIGEEQFLDHRVEPRIHAQALLPMIDGLMAKAGVEYGQLTGLVYGRGPGSFTGVRVAVAVAQGLSLAREIPTLGVSTLAAIAHAAFLQRESTEVVAALDARMGEIYLGTYRWDAAAGLPVLEGAEQVCGPEALAACSSTAVFAGPGTERYREHVPGAMMDGLLPSASALLGIAGASAATDDWQAAGEATPVYLRDKVALTETERGVGNSTGLS